MDLPSPDKDHNFVPPQLNVNKRWIDFLPSTSPIPQKVKANSILPFNEEYVNFSSLNQNLRNRDSSQHHPHTLAKITLKADSNFNPPGSVEKFNTNTGKFELNQVFGSKVQPSLSLMVSPTFDYALAKSNVTKQMNGRHPSTLIFPPKSMIPSEVPIKEISLILASQLKRGRTPLSLSFP